ncbi:MAG: hypothetical protein K2Z81_08960 [Cyanobacteria bacterium]|nr:hypothetical protein [Cyanobacteriota bacterium]
MISIVLSGCILSLPSEAASPFCGTALESTVLDNLNGSPQLHSSDGDFLEESGTLTLSFPEEINDSADDSLPDGKNKGSRWIVLPATQVHPGLVVISSSPATASQKTLPVRAKSRGFQLQVYESNDEPPHATSTIQSYFKPPQKLGGGLFHSRGNRLRSAFLGRPQSRTSKMPKQFAAGAICHRADWRSHLELSHRFSMITSTPAYTYKLWLLNRALLV